MGSAPGHRISASAIVLLCGVAAAGTARSAVIRVPQDESRIDTAIAAASNGDTVLVARGVHDGGLTIAGKTITLASLYVYSRDLQDISETIIDGGSPILTIEEDVGSSTTIEGLTFRNGGYHLVNYARRVNILNNRFLNGGDQVSFENAGGVVRGCFFDGASDDGIDCDDASDPLIEENTIQNAGNDGIEIRLHSHTGSMLSIVVRNNVITGAEEDGVQLIDYAGASSRLLRIEGNVLANNGAAGVGCMANGGTTENFAGAPLAEEVQVVNNTFVGNPQGLTGGDRMLVMNNVFMNATRSAVKRVLGSSWVTRNLFWGNATHSTNSNVDGSTTWIEDPLLVGDYVPMQGSPCIDRGAATISWSGKFVLSPTFTGTAPDLGARESGTAPIAVEDIEVAPSEASLEAPSGPRESAQKIVYALPSESDVELAVYDVMGRRLTRLVSERRPRGRHTALWDVKAVRSGIYWVRLNAAGRVLTVRKLLLR